MFTLEHFIWIGLCVVMIAALTFVSVKFKFSFKTAALIMAGIALCSELMKIFTHMEAVNPDNPAQGMVIEATALPFHLCSILIFAYFYLPFSKEGKVREFLTSFSIPVAFIGGTLAILMATSGTDFAKPYAYQCFVYHAGILWFAIYLILTKQVEMGKKKYLQNVATLAAIAIVMIWVNGALQEYNTNFFYVVRPPVKGLPLLNLDHGWYVYFAHLCCLGVLGVTLVHLPSMIADFLRKKKSTTKEGAAETQTKENLQLTA